MKRIFLPTMCLVALFLACTTPLRAEDEQQRRNDEIIRHQQAEQQRLENQRREEDFERQQKESVRRQNEDWEAANRAAGGAPAPGGVVRAVGAAGPVVVIAPGRPQLFIPQPGVVANPWAVAQARQAAQLRLLQAQQMAVRRAALRPAWAR